MITLIKPSFEHKEAYIDMIKEWKDFGGPFVPCIIEYDCSNPIDELNYDGLLKVVEDYGFGIQEDKEYYDRADFYFIYDDERLVGAGMLRYNLTELGNNTLGNIGCGIRPSERKKGYSIDAVGKMIDIARKEGLKEVVECHYADVEVSMKILEHFGFLYLGEVISPVTGKKIKRYLKKL